MIDTEKTMNDALQRHYLFSALDSSTRDKLLGQSRRVDLQTGQMLFRQGDHAASFFIVITGTIKLYRVSPDGQEKVMRLLQSGQSFAESIMFMEDPQYPVHAEALENSSLLAVEGRSCLELFESSFSTIMAVMGQMTKRIQKHWDEIESLTTQNSRYRIVHYILDLLSGCNRHNTRIRLPQHKVLISSQLGIRPETF